MEQEVNITPFAYAMSLIGGKWKMHILFWLWKKEVLRYSCLLYTSIGGLHGAGDPAVRYGHGHRTDSRAD